MSAQTSYNYSTPKGIAGSLFDMAPYAIDSRLNGEAQAGTLKFGMGAMQGTTPGSDVKVPATGATVATFEGIVLNGFSTQQTMQGIVEILPSQTVGVLRYGKVWARIVDGIIPSYGQSVYLVISGENAGLFTNAADAEGSTTIAIKARFIGSKGTGNVAPLELFNQAQN